jgi:hypothetical protein
MKTKSAWLMVVTAITTFRTFAADYVAPDVIPYNYTSDYGVQWDVPTYADYTWKWEAITGYIFNYNAWREEFWIQPDWEGVYVEVDTHINWSNPTFPATDGSHWRER